MQIKKGEKTYTVCECKEHWSVSIAENVLSVQYNVDKELCKTEEELAEYIKSNDMF